MSEQNLDSKTEQDEDTVSSELKPMLDARWCEFNLNHKIKVKLTEHGKKLLIRKWGKFPSWWRKDENGFATVQALEFMNTFGSELYMGNPKMPCVLTIYFDTEGI